MRRLVAAGIVVVVVAIAVALMLQPPDAPVPTPTTPQIDDVPVFEVVKVQNTQHEGLTLKGVVRDVAGKPIPGADVFLTASGQQSLVSFACPVCKAFLLQCRSRESIWPIERALHEHRGELVAGAQTKSNDKGEFRFEHLVGISFTVWGRAAGYGDGIKERAAPGDPVELFLPAPRAIPGKLRGEDGAPIARGTVRAISARISHVIETTSDADGRFELSGLGEGPFTVLASAPNRLPARLQNVEAGSGPRTLTLGTPRKLVVNLVSGGKPVDGQVFLRADHLDRSATTKKGTIEFGPLFPGTVAVSALAGDLTAAVQEVTLDSEVTTLTLTLARGGMLLVSVVDEEEQPVPDPQVELLTRDSILVAERKATTGQVITFGPVAAGDYFVRGTADGFETELAPALVKPGTSEVVMTLKKGTVLAGRVTDEYGRVAPNISVLITPTGDVIFADAEGKFRTRVPSPGRYELHAHHSDWGGADLQVTAPKTDIELQLEPKASADITVMSEGRRVEGAHATLFYEKGNFRSDRPSGADGIVRMRGLPAGNFMLVVTHEEYLESTPTKITLEDGSNFKITVELKQGAAVSGQVVDESSVPVANVQVVTHNKMATTDVNGQFSLRPLRPGISYVVRVMERGLEQITTETVKAGGDPIRIVVRRQPKFRGRVLSEGQPLKHFRVNEFDVTTEDGRFEMALPVRGNDVMVSIDAPGYEPIIEPRPKTNDLGDFFLQRAPTMSGVVRDDAGPVPDAVVTCDTCEQSVMSGRDGRFMLAKPPYQAEMLIVAKKGRRSGSTTVTENHLEGIEVRMKPSVMLSGSLTLPDGTPGGGVEISGFHVDRNEQFSVVTNGDGTYQVETPPGVHRLMVLSPDYARASREPLSLVVDVSEAQSRLDIGPRQGLGQVTVHVVPKPGYALWIVRGSLSTVGDPPLELLRATYAQFVYEPRSPVVTFTGLTAGAYTLVWASFHAPSQGGPVLMPVRVPGSEDVTLPR